MIKEKLHIIDVTPKNVLEETLFCIKDIKKPGFESKRQWFEKRYKEGLRLRILKDETNKMLGFIEFVPSEMAWRPIDSENFMFIHCMYVYSKKDRNQGLGSMLVNEAEKEARAQNKLGVCVMTGKGSWMADRSIFEKLGFNQVDSKDRFELLSKSWSDNAETPKLIDWTTKQSDYQGWNLLYSDQCPWHEKSAFDLYNTGLDFGIDLKITKISTAKQAQQAPSGFGVFSLLHDGKLLEDHYISATRFKNILKKTLS